MRVGLLFDHIDVEEKLFFDSGHSIEKINSSEIALKLSEVKRYDIVINRAESKYRRRKLAKIFEGYGCEVINNYSVEEVCCSKFETKMALSLQNVPTTEAAFKFGFPFAKIGDKYVKQATEIRRLKKLIAELKPCISKPDLGSRGKSIVLINDEAEFDYKINEYERAQRIPEAFKPTLLSPEGVLLEKYQPHALDLRVVVYKTYKGPEKVFGSLVRAAPSEDIIAKNTSLGGIPIGLETTHPIRNLVLKCMRALGKYINRVYARKLEYYLVGVEVLPANLSLDDRNEIYNSLRGLAKYMEEIRKAKKKRGLAEIDKAFKKYRESREYITAQEKCLEYLDRSRLLITEVNSTPDFGINTRNLVGNLVTGYDEIGRAHV